jgi:zinc D-Ala-D-Ala dipeptidase
MILLVTRLFRPSFALSFLIFSSFFPLLPAPQSQTAAPTADSILPGPTPLDVSSNWKNLVGIYGEEKTRSITILERDGKLFLIAPFLYAGDNSNFPIQQIGNFSFSFPNASGPPIQASAVSDTSGHVTHLVIIPDFHGSSDTTPDEPKAYRIVEPWHFPRADAGSDPALFYHVTPAQPVAELRKHALNLAPPAEAGPFRKPDLVELATLDPAIHLDIRYANSNNFLRTPIYTEARAFMQRPAAESLLRALRKLQTLGYGLLIHDAYRPWYVTKIFWDATPPEGKIFVADPQNGSKHNRGCAVDLTLYDLSSGKAVEMPSLYDEMSPRSFPNFPGGTSLQRWHRDLLRLAMESEGFAVNEDEWWHFDYKDWKQYGILNVPFEKITVGLQPAAVSH